MKKLLFILLFTLSFITTFSQEQNEQKKIETLVQKVDSLEHELAYLRLSYELYTLNSDISALSNEMYTKYVAIKSEIYNKDFSYKLGRKYKEMYESYKSKLESYAKLIDVKKKLFYIMILTNQYTDGEQNVLTSSYELLDLLTSSSCHPKII